MNTVKIHIIMKKQLLNETVEIIMNMVGEMY